MQQLISGAFRNDGTASVLVDGPPASGEGWTTGATIVDLVTPSILIGQKWTVVAWTISFIGAIQAGSSGPTWAKLGKVLGGLVTQGAARTFFPGSVPYVQPIQSFPGDVSTLTTIWDGNTDPAFPLLASAATQPGAAIVHSEQLPVPVSVSSGTQLGIGLWLTPSLIPSGGLPLIHLLNGKYSITFDDGRGA